MEISKWDACQYQRRPKGCLMRNHDEEANCDTCNDFKRIPCDITLKDMLQARGFKEGSWCVLRDDEKRDMAEDRPLHKIHIIHIHEDYLVYDEEGKEECTTWRIADQHDLDRFTKTWRCMDLDNDNVEQKAPSSAELRAMRDLGAVPYTGKTNDTPDPFAKGREVLREMVKASKGKKYDADKLRWDLLPLHLISLAVEVLTYGAAKYGPNNWQSVSDAKDRYFAALMRHVVAYRNGESRDTESGVSHLAHALCNLIFLDHFEEDKQT